MYSQMTNLSKKLISCFSLNFRDGDPLPTFLFSLTRPFSWSSHISTKRNIFAFFHFLVHSENKKGGQIVVEKNKRKLLHFYLKKSLSILTKPSTCWKVMHFNLKRKMNRGVSNFFLYLSIIAKAFAIYHFYIGHIGNKSLPTYPNIF